MLKERIVLIEFNELCPGLLDTWMAEGRLPNFKKFHDASQTFITEPDETNPPYLEPWIQWYSIHTGLSYRQHGVFHLSDGPQADHDDLWRILIDGGRRVGNFSSMNARGVTSPGSFFLPDPWCTSEPAYPAELGAVARFVAHHVQEHSNANDGGLGLGPTVAFLRTLVSRGLTARTLKGVVQQIAAERSHGAKVSWKRAALLDRIHFDLFRHYVRTLRPSFATFFSNSTAHYQHSYWRHMAPQVFVHRPAPEELATYRDAILFGYQQMDALLAEFERFESEGVTLILATALSQQPYLKKEVYGGQHFYRPHRVEDLLAKLDIRCRDIVPVMAHQYVVRFEDDEQTKRAEERLRRLTYGAQEVFGFSASEPRSLYFGNQIQTEVPDTARIQMTGHDPQEVGFYDLFYRLPETKSGCHHPDGVLWIKTGHPSGERERVSILDIFPTLLEHFGVTHANGEKRLGRSLLHACV